jgi:hypothetical protein
MYIERTTEASRRQGREFMLNWWQLHDLTVKWWSPIIIWWLSKNLTGGQLQYYYVVGVTNIFGRFL